MTLPAAPRLAAAKEYLGIPVVVAICGSTRFMAEMAEADLRETVAGRIVVKPGCNLKEPHPLWADPAEAEALKVRLDHLHRAKIRLADEVLVVGDYIGDATRAEIVYARSLGKHVRFTHPQVDPNTGTYESDLAAAKRAGRAWGCTCGADNPPHYDACHDCQRPSWTCAACGTVNTCGRGDCNECGNTMPAELLGDRDEGFEMSYPEWINTQVGPRVVGGRYDHGDDASAYEVLAVDRGPRPLGTWPVWQITVRYDRDGRETTHCSGWNPAKDRVLSSSPATSSRRDPS